MFCTRILKTDHYQGHPIRSLDVCYSDFRATEVDVVPVLRIFGVTPCGQKTCVHVHGVFPYLYVPYDGTEPQDRYLRQFASSVDKALNVALGRAASNTHHVYKISLVSGLPFYGYHEGEIPFLKIYLYNPIMVKKTADLLLGGAVMNKIYQPYESHIPYNLQFFIDYNLYGMNMINVSAVKFRQTSMSDVHKVSGSRFSDSGSPSLLHSTSPHSTPSTPSTVKWDTENIPEALWLDGTVERQSVCELEVDVVAGDILNRLEVGDSVGSNPGLAALWEDERQRRLARDINLDMEPPGSPERGDICWTTAEAQLQERLAEIVEQLRPYLDEESVCGSPLESSLSYPATPSSQVESHHHHHHSQGDTSSQDSIDTVVLESPPSEEVAVVNKHRILHVVSSSQSFSEQRGALLTPDAPDPHTHPLLDTTEDQDLACLLAQLAEGSSPPGGSVSQTCGGPGGLEEQDSVLSQLHTSPPLEGGGERGGEEEEEEETLEMTQRVWTEDADNNTCDAPVDLEGMDMSWNSSAWMPVVEDKDMDCDIPQLDGPIDDKLGNVPPKKRLGMRGPASLMSPFSLSLYSPDAQCRFKAQAMQHMKTRDLRVCLTDISSVLGSMLEAPPYSDPQPHMDLRAGDLSEACSPPHTPATSDTELKSYLDTGSNHSHVVVSDTDSQGGLSDSHSQPCGVSSQQVDTPHLTPRQVTPIQTQQHHTSLADNNASDSQHVNLTAENKVNSKNTKLEVVQNGENHVDSSNLQWIIDSANSKDVVSENKNDKSHVGSFVDTQETANTLNGIDSVSLTLHTQQTQSVRDIVKKFEDYGISKKSARERQHKPRAKAVTKVVSPPRSYSHRTSKLKCLAFLKEVTDSKRPVEEDTSHTRYLEEIKEVTGQGMKGSGNKRQGQESTGRKPPSDQGTGANTHVDDNKKEKVKKGGDSKKHLLRVTDGKIQSDNVVDSCADEENVKDSKKQVKKCLVSKRHMDDCTEKIPSLTCADNDSSLVISTENCEPKPDVSEIYMKVATDKGPQEKVPDSVRDLEETTRDIPVTAMLCKEVRDSKKNLKDNIGKDISEAVIENKRDCCETTEKNETTREAMDLANVSKELAENDVPTKETSGRILESATENKRNSEETMEDMAERDKKIVVDTKRNVEETTHGHIPEVTDNKRHFKEITDRRRDSEDTETTILMKEGASSKTCLAVNTEQNKPPVKGVTHTEVLDLSKDLPDNKRYFKEVTDSKIDIRKHGITKVTDDRKFTDSQRPEKVVKDCNRHKTEVKVHETSEKSLEVLSNVQKFKSLTLNSALMKDILENSKVPIVELTKLKVKGNCPVKIHTDRPLEEKLNIVTSDSDTSDTKTSPRDVSSISPGSGNRRRRGSRPFSDGGYSAKIREKLCDKSLDGVPQTMRLKDTGTSPEQLPISEGNNSNPPPGDGSLDFTSFTLPYDFKSADPLTPEDKQPDSQPGITIAESDLQRTISIVPSKFRAVKRQTKVHFKKVKQAFVNVDACEKRSMGSGSVSGESEDGPVEFGDGDSSVSTPWPGREGDSGEEEEEGSTDHRVSRCLSPADVSPEPSDGEYELVKPEDVTIIQKWTSVEEDPQSPHSLPPPSLPPPSTPPHSTPPNRTSPHRTPPHKTPPHTPSLYDRCILNRRHSESSSDEEADLWRVGPHYKTYEQRSYWPLVNQSKNHVHKGQPHYSDISADEMAADASSDSEVKNQDDCSSDWVNDSEQKQAGPVPQSDNAASLTENAQAYQVSRDQVAAGSVHHKLSDLSQLKDDHSDSSTGSASNQEAHACQSLTNHESSSWHQDISWSEATSNRAKSPVSFCPLSQKASSLAEEQHHVRASVQEIPMIDVNPVDNWGNDYSHSSQYSEQMHGKMHQGNSISKQFSDGPSSYNDIYCKTDGYGYITTNPNSYSGGEVLQATGYPYHSESTDGYPLTKLANMNSEWKAEQNSGPVCNPHNPQNSSNMDCIQTDRAPTDDSRLNDGAIHSDQTFSTHHEHGKDYIQLENISSSKERNLVKVLLEETFKSDKTRDEIVVPPSTIVGSDTADISIKNIDRTRKNSNIDTEDTQVMQNQGKTCLDDTETDTNLFKFLLDKTFNSEKPKGEFDESSGMATKDETLEESTSSNNTSEVEIVQESLEENTFDVSENNGESNLVKILLDQTFSSEKPESKLADISEEGTESEKFNNTTESVITSPDVEIIDSPGNDSFEDSTPRQLSESQDNYSQIDKSEKVDAELKISAENVTVTKGAEGKEGKIFDSIESDILREPNSVATTQSSNLYKHASSVFNIQFQNDAAQPITIDSDSSDCEDDGDSFEEAENDSVSTEGCGDSDVNTIESHPKSLSQTSQDIVSHSGEKYVPTHEMIQDNEPFEEAENDSVSAEGCGDSDVNTIESPPKSLSQTSQDIVSHSGEKYVPTHEIIQDNETDSPSGEPIKCDNREHISSDCTKEVGTVCELIADHTADPALWDVVVEKAKSPGEDVCDPLPSAILEPCILPVADKEDESEAEPEAQSAPSDMSVSPDRVIETSETEMLELESRCTSVVEHAEDGEEPAVENPLVKQGPLASDTTDEIQVPCLQPEYPQNDTRNTMEENQVETACSNPNDEPPLLVNELESSSGNYLPGSEALLDTFDTAPVLVPYEGETLIPDYTEEEISNHENSCTALDLSGKVYSSSDSPPTETAHWNATSPVVFHQDLFLAMDHCEEEVCEELVAGAEDCDDVVDLSKCYTNKEVQYDSDGDVLEPSPTAVPDTQANQKPDATHLNSVNTESDYQAKLSDPSLEATAEYTGQSQPPEIKTFSDAVIIDLPLAVEKPASLQLSITKKFTDCFKKFGESLKSGKVRSSGQATTLADRKEKLRLKKEEKQQQQLLKDPVSPTGSNNKRFENAFDMLNSALYQTRKEASSRSTGGDSGKDRKKQRRKPGDKNSDGSKFRSVSKIVKKRKSVEGQTKRSADDSVSYPYSSKVFYVNGLSTASLERKTRHLSSNVEGTVRVLKLDCQEYDLTKVGNEKLSLPLLSERKIQRIRERMRPELIENNQTDLSLNSAADNKPPDVSVSSGTNNNPSDCSVISGTDIVSTDDILQEELSQNNVELTTEDDYVSQGDSEVSDTEGDNPFSESSSQQRSPEGSISIDLRGFTTCKVLSKEESVLDAPESESTASVFSECIEMKRKEVLPPPAEPEVKEERENKCQTPDESQPPNLTNTVLCPSSCHPIKKKSQERKARKSKDFGFLFGTGDAVLPSKKSCQKSSKSREDNHKSKGIPAKCKTKQLCTHPKCDKGKCVHSKNTKVDKNVVEQTATKVTVAKVHKRQKSKNDVDKMDVGSKLSLKKTGNEKTDGELNISSHPVNSGSEGPVTSSHSDTGSMTSTIQCPPDQDQDSAVIQIYQNPLNDSKKYQKSRDRLKLKQKPTKSSDAGKQIVEVQKSRKSETHKKGSEEKKRRKSNDSKQSRKESELSSEKLQGEVDSMTGSDTVEGMPKVRQSTKVSERDGQNTKKSVDTKCIRETKPHESVGINDGDKKADIAIVVSYLLKDLPSDVNSLNKQESIELTGMCPSTAGLPTAVTPRDTAEKCPEQKQSDAGKSEGLTEIKAVDSAEDMIGDSSDMNNEVEHNTFTQSSPLISDNNNSTEQKLSSESSSQNIEIGDGTKNSNVSEISVIQGNGVSDSCDLDNETYMTEVKMACESISLSNESDALYPADAMMDGGDIGTGHNRYTQEISSTLTHSGSGQVSHTESAESSQNSSRESQICDQRDIEAVIDCDNINFVGVVEEAMASEQAQVETNRKRSNDETKDFEPLINDNGVLDNQITAHDPIQEINESIGNIGERKDVITKREKSKLQSVYERSSSVDEYTTDPGIITKLSDKSEFHEDCSVPIDSGTYTSTICLSTDPDSRAIKISNASTCLDARKRRLSDNSSEDNASPVKKTAIEDTDTGHLMKGRHFNNEERNIFESSLTKETEKSRKSSSEYEQELEVESIQVVPDSLECKKATKKRKLPNRLDSAFCKPSSSRKRKIAEKKKFIDTLSVLHQATVDKLKGDELNSPSGSDNSNEQLVSIKDLECSFSNKSEPCFPQDSSHVFPDVYAQNVDRDHCIDFSDVLSKLAYLSSVTDEAPESPPNTWSPSRDTSGQAPVTTDVCRDEVLYQYDNTPANYLSSMHILEKYSNNQVLNGCSHSSISSPDSMDLSPEIPVQHAAHTECERFNLQEDTGSASPLSPQNPASPCAGESTPLQSATWQESLFDIKEIPGSPQADDCPASPEAEGNQNFNLEFKEIPNYPQEISSCPSSPMNTVNAVTNAQAREIPMATTTDYMDNIAGDVDFKGKLKPSSRPDFVSHTDVSKHNCSSAFAKVKTTPVRDKLQPHADVTVENANEEMTVYSSLSKGLQTGPSSVESTKPSAVYLVSERNPVLQDVHKDVRTKERPQFPTEISDGPLSPVPETFAEISKLREIPFSPREIETAAVSSPKATPSGYLKKIPSSPVQMNDAPLSPTQIPSSPVQMQDAPLSPTQIPSSPVQMQDAPLSPTQIPSSPVQMQDAPLSPTQIPSSPVQMQDASLSPAQIPSSPVQMNDAPLSPTQIPSSPVQMQDAPLSPTQIPSSHVQMQDAPLSPTQIPSSPVQIQDAPLSPTQIPSSPSQMQDAHLSPTQIPSSPVQMEYTPLPPLCIPSSPVELYDAPLSPSHEEQTYHQLKEIPGSPVELLNGGEQYGSPLSCQVESPESIRSPSPAPIKSRSPSPDAKAAEKFTNKKLKKGPVEIPLTMEDNSQSGLHVGSSNPEIQKKHKRIGNILHERMKHMGHFKNRATSPYGKRGSISMSEGLKLTTKKLSVDDNVFEQSKCGDAETNGSPPHQNSLLSGEKKEAYVCSSNTLVQHMYGKDDGSPPSIPQTHSDGDAARRGGGNRSSGGRVPVTDQWGSPGSQDSGDQDPDGGQRRVFRAVDTACIITPLRPPPSRRFIIEDALRLGIIPEYGAFCTNPQDIPDRPRELGGKILKLDSHLVKDLPEYTSSLQGIKLWQRNMYRSHIRENMSQDTSEDILQQIEKYPQFRIAMFGDSSVTITPSKTPPSPRAVGSWLRKKKLYLDMKKSNSTTPSDKDLGKNSEKKTDHLTVVAPRKYKKGPNFKTSKKVKIEEVKVADKSQVMQDSDISFQPISPPAAMKSILKSPEPELRTPSVKRQRVAGSAKAHTPEPAASATPGAPTRFTSSTPARRVSFEDSMPSLTPIPKIPRSARRKSRSRSHSPAEDLDAEEEVEADVIPPTPERPVSAKTGRVKSIRRLSTGTDTSLRRSILASQIKSQNQFSTPQSMTGHDVSQIDGPTPKNRFGFRVNSQCVQDAKALHEHQYITVLSMEVHARTRGDYRPDPENDPICAIVYSIFHDIPAEEGDRYTTGVILVDPASASQHRAQGSGHSQAASGGHLRPASELLLHKAGLPNVHVTYTDSEKDLLQGLVDLVHRWDPDILVGFEVQMLSWGFLLQRASHLSKDLTKELSRLPEMTKGKQSRKDKDDEMLSDIDIPGRIVLDLWRVIRSEVTLNIYSFENVVYHVLHRRVPLYPFKMLTFWFDHKLHIHRWRTLEYYIVRARGCLDIMDKLDVVGQTSEFARVFGIEFYHVLSRGSQYRVESMMLRIAKPMNYIPVSPSVQQRARMRAPECIPLTMEPESKLYTDPVVVVDFQSLYPSIMMAYNYCYSTCLGRINMLQSANEGAFEFGCTSLQISPKQLEQLKDDISVCPNGVCFVREHIKKGILPRMVGDILKTRLMVKKAMKEYKGDQTLQRLLHARQLGLKLIANVTFGYTSANFSGRMPCMEIGDSIVRKARETLERAIELVEKTSKWGAKVVYGDTDSMFIELKGRTKDEAFIIGQEIADAVTADNPKPVKLKFEKVYLPCVLQTKKRYVGFMYETADQKEPVFDAKGIETVRRDTCASVSKVLEKSIKILFTSHDVSQVKSYVKKQWTKLHEGKVSIQDCIFAKEYRGQNGYKPGACVPALDIARKRLSHDRRGEPRAGERVPYVIVYGSPGLPLIQLVREPGALLTDPSLRINATYYITKQLLPPLDRILSLMGVDVKEWYQELPRVARTQPQALVNTETRKGTISQYFHSLNCPVCEEMTQQGLCAACKTDPQRTAVILNTRIRRAERTFFQLYQVCCNCMGGQDSQTPCISLDCPLMFRLNKATRDMSQVKQLNQLKHKLLQF